MAALSTQQKLDLGWYWRVPARRELVHAPLGAGAVSDAEAQLGVKLPAAYLALLQRQNGGVLRATWPASYAECVWGIGSDAPSITHDRALWRPTNLRPGAWSPRQAALLVPFDGADVWDMCLDYRHHGPHGEPSITLVDSECAEEEPIAANFTAFLAGLVDRLASSFRLHGNVTPEQLARTLAQRLGASPPHIDQAAHGFPSWRIALRGDHQWCWLSNNRVPAAYHQDPTTKRPRPSPETALQLPEDPACTVLVSCTPESRPTIEAALTQSRS